MSCVECYVRLKSTNKWELAYEVGNSWQGSMHLWNALEKKYLPSYECLDADGNPDYLTFECFKKKRYNHRSCYCVLSEGEKTLCKKFGICPVTRDYPLWN